ncbi:EF-P lysine aminoacylase EpmA [Kaarinaea lacus]
MEPGSGNRESRWWPSAPLETIQVRAKLLARLRSYFATAGVLEVDTPIMVSGTIPDPHIPSFSVNPNLASTRPGTLGPYLGSSPEFAMKRLLAAGSGSIYQVCKAFRQGEQGRFHNPEFTLVEWYRTGFDHHRLMDDVSALVTSLAEGYRTLEAEERLTYRSVFQRYLGVDPFDDVQVLRTCAQDHGMDPVSGLDDQDRDGWLDLMISQCIQPRLGENRLTFVYDYPASQAALSRIRADIPPVAERFELFIDGVELANGFHELQDAREQRERFEHDLQRREISGLEPVMLDEYFLDALEAGLPGCSGVALGLERLQMVLTGAGSLAEVMLFPHDRI